MHLCCFYALLSFEGLLMVTIKVSAKSFRPPVGAPQKNQTEKSTYNVVIVLLLRSGNEVGINIFYMCISKFEQTIY